ncbi:MAG: YqgE/AlgH family protein [Bacteroidales bacterium]
MKTTDIKPAQGSLLISEPFLKDHYFRRSVILLAEHDDKGSFGLIINKPLDIRLNEIVKDFPAFGSKLYIGGPVGTDSIFVLHTLGNKIKNSLKIIQGLYWGGDIDIIKSMIEDKKIHTEEIRFYIGYSGWDAKQLDRELEEHSWVVTKAKSDKLLFESPENMWKNILKSMGNEYAMWVNYPLDPMMN